MSRRADRWTQDILVWEPWVEQVPDDALTDRHRTVLTRFAPVMAASAYYRVLVRSPSVLAARTQLFNACLRGDLASVSRADRELAAVGSSRITGCVYCASVHARAFSGLVHERDTVQRVLDEGTSAEIAAREQAIVGFSAAVAERGAVLDGTDTASLKNQGFDDQEIFDIALAAAMFANANRLMLSLGEAVVD